MSVPIAEHGTVSKNGLLYDDDLLSSIEAQINDQRPGGTFGHLKDEDRASAFPLPAGLWIGAKRVGNTLWAKSYIPPGAARDYVRNLKAVGGQIATSIYGRAGKFEKVREGVKRAIDFKLESLDFAPPARAANGLGAVPHLTTEMEEPQEALLMPTREELLQELRGIEVPAQKGWQAVKPPEKEEGQVSELTQIRELLGDGDLVKTVKELRETVAAMTERDIERRIQELVEEGVKLSSARGLITRLIKAQHPTSVEEAEEAYQQVVELEEVKEILSLTIRELSGPSAIVHGKVREAGRPKLEDTPENRARAAAQMGIAI